METYSSRYPHFWLYAKHWYEHGDLMEDSKVLVANYCGGERKFITQRDCFEMWMHAFEEATRHCKVSDADYRKILEKIWKRSDSQDILARLYEPQKVEYIIIEAIVSTLGMVAVRNSKLYNPDVDDTLFIEFGVPDEKVLPLTKSAKERVATA